MSRIAWRRAGAAVLAAGCLVLVAACGTAKEDPNDPKNAAGCKADFALSDGYDKLFTQTPALQGGKPPTKAQLPKIQANYDRLVAAPLAELEKNAADDIAGDVEKAAAASKELRATGDARPFRSPAFTVTKTTIDGYYYEECSGQKAEITGVDFRYEGVNGSYEPGEIRIKFPNEGKEEHELVLVKKNPGVKQSFDQLLELPREKAASKVEFLGGDEAAPGGETYVNADLTPGDYLMVCFIPQGSLPGKEGKGKPHFALGMREEFRVK
ncbi:MAG: hypothetical protein ACR2ML_00255 [Solirubrobacteraceae bacterium]